MQLEQSISRGIHRFFFLAGLLTALLALPTGAAAQTSKGPILKAGEILKSGEALTSRNGRFSASFSAEGNFILYQGATPTWSVGTGRRASGPYRAGVFADGSFAVAGTSANGAPVALWDSKSGGKPVGNYFLILGDDGFLTLYIGTDPNQPAGALWRSGGTTVQGTLASPLSAQFAALSAAQRAQLSPAQLAAYDADPTVVKARADAGAAATAAAAKAAADAAAMRTVLKAGETLKPGEYLVAPSKNFFAIMQGDGNFVVYPGAGPGANTGAARFSTNSAGQGSTFAALQADGNFVIYTAAGKPLYDTKTYGLGNGDYSAVVQDDGSFVVRGTSANKQPVLWSSASGSNPAFATAGGKVAAEAAKVAAAATAKASADAAKAAADTAAAYAAAKAAADNAPLKTARRSLKAGEAMKSGEHLLSPHGGAYAVMQADGNFLAYSGTPSNHGPAMFSSNTAGNPGASAAMQADGNFVIYSAAGKPLFDTKTWGWGNGAYVATLAENGAFEVRGAPTGRPSALLWSSATGANPEIPTAGGKAVGEALTAKANAEAAARQAARDAALKLARDKAAAVFAARRDAGDRRNGEPLNAGEELSSPDAEQYYYAVMQDDGNLVIYSQLGPGNTRDERRKTKRQMWSSGTGGRPPFAYSAMVSNDGNLVIYGPNKSVVWQSGTGGNAPGNYYLAMAPSGNLVVGMGTDLNQSYLSVWNSEKGKLPERHPIERFKPTENQRSWLSPAQFTWATAWAPTEEVRAELIRKQTLEVALIRAKNIAAAEHEDWKRRTAEFEKTHGVYCPEQLGDDRVAGQGRGDREPMTVNTKRLGDNNLATTIRTRNCLPVAIWVTIHDVTRTFVKDGGCVPAHSLKDWQGGPLLAGYYYVRAEILESRDCLAAVKDSTRIRADVGFDDLGAGMSFDLMMGSQKNYYWEHPVKVGKGTLSAAGEMFTDLGEATGITDALRTAWDVLTGNCAVIARYMPDPITQFMRVAEAYGPSSLQTPTQCYRQGLESFYCQFPAELGRQVSGGGSSASALPALGQRLWNESQTAECRYFYALTPVVPGAPMFCAMSKLVVEDSRKAVQCAMAAERTGAVKEMLSTAPAFPSEDSCRGLGEVAFKVAMKVATGSKPQPGSGGTIKAMAQEFRTMYKAAGIGATALARFEKKLAEIPACRD